MFWKESGHHQIRWFGRVCTFIILCVYFFFFLGGGLESMFFVRIGGENPNNWLLNEWLGLKHT